MAERLRTPREVAVDDAGLLAEVPLLRNLRAVHLAALAAAATRQKAPAGQTLVAAGRPTPGLIVVARGRAVRAGLDLTVGDAVEERAAFDSRTAEESVIAVDDVEYLLLPARALHQAVRDDPELGIALLRELSHGGAAPEDDAPEQLLRYASDLRESYREGERRQEALRQSVLGAVRGLVDLAEAKDPASRGHASRAAHTARALAVTLGWPEDDVNHAALGGLLHDVGFVVVESAILHASGPLSAADQRQILQHPTVGARIIEHIDFLRPVVPFVLCHHERYDGRGYPRGLIGKAIPLAGRLMAAVELFETMRTSQRGTVAGVGPQGIARILRGEIGRQLDRDIANALAGMLESGELPVG